MLRLIFVALVLFALLEGVLLLRLRSQVSTYKTYWGKQANEVASSDAIWYVTLGDSASQGIGASRPEKSYVSRIAEHLAVRYGRPIHVVNLSVSGAKVEDVIKKQMPTLNKMKLPTDSIVVLEIGANNMMHFDRVSFETDFEDLLRQLPSQTYVADIPYFGKGVFKNRESKVVAANSIIHKLVLKHGLRLVPLHDATESKGSWLNNSSDMFHPNDRGYSVWYGAFTGILDKQ